MIDLLQNEYEKAHLNLALEEAILEEFIKTASTPLIRVWENPELSVVLGRGEKTEQQVNLDACKKKDVPVLRRVSGGGTVVHGQGNLNLSFFLPWEFSEDLKSIPASYQLILGWVKEAIRKSTGVSLELNGTCDLCLGEKKVSGTAQARKRYGLLHHLTLLLDFDLKAISDFLREPLKRPDYRSDRNHLDFVTSLGQEGILLSRKSLLNSLQDCMGEMNEISSISERITQRWEMLAEKKYQSDEWNLKGRTPSA